MGVRVGYVGVGGMAGAHLGTQRKFDDVEIVALCDINPEVLARRANENNVTKTYTDYRRMLDAEELDVVYVCVPPFAHADIEENVAAKGCAVFSEKPVCLRLEDAIRKYEAIRKAGVVNGVGYCVRYLNTVDVMLDRVRDVKLEVAHGHYMGGMPGGPGHWWRQQAKSGGQLIEQTTHILDLALYTVGDVEAVGGAFVTRTPVDETADVANASVVFLYYKNGCIGTITSACMLSIGYKTPGLNLFAKDFVLEFDYGKMQVRTPAGTEDFKTEVNMVELEDRVFLDAVKSKDMSKVRATYLDGVKTLEVSVLAYAAAEKRAILPTSFEG
jgi:predicted dehydrogenase